MRCVFLPAARLLIIASVALGCESAPTPLPELQAVLGGARPAAISETRWQEVQAFYASRAGLAWVDAEGPTARTDAALDALNRAHAHGLAPADYREPELRAEAAELRPEDATPERAGALAALDVHLTAALLELGHHVATGRLTPKSIDARWNARRTSPDIVAALAAAADDDAVAAFPASVQPVHPEYAALSAALVALQARTDEGWTTVPATPVTPNQTRPAVVVPLRQRLAAGGYLASDAALESGRYDAAVQTAVKAFQQHHGLAETGSLDRATIDALNVSRAHRIQQVTLNLERWRWLPDDLGERHFLVNVPSFHLIAREQGNPVLDIRVVVGKQGDETPLFSDEMETVVFSPYWNVPETIALEETAPAAMKDPDYLSRNNMEVVDRAGRVVAGNEIPWDDASALENYRFRQRPGADNALGYVKFLFPNEHAVYLHDTPADALFKRIGRAFSHGCVRVEEPEALAQYVLRDQPEWTGDAIRAAMRAGEERHVKLATPIPVHIVYMTAWVDPKGGLHFERDVYGYDARQAGQ